MRVMPMGLSSRVYHAPLTFAATPAVRVPRDGQDGEPSEFLPQCCLGVAVFRQRRIGEEGGEPLLITAGIASCLPVRPGCRRCR